MYLLVLAFVLQTAHPQAAHPQAAHPHTNARPPVPPAPQGIYGTWMAKDTTILNIYPCGVVNGEGDQPNVACVRMVEPAKGKLPDARDLKNPDPKERGRPLGPELVGTGFKLSNENHAADGKLYDPYNGKTYKTTATLENGVLKLRSRRFLFFGHTLVCRRVTLAKPSPYKR